MNADGNGGTHLALKYYREGIDSFQRRWVHFEHASEPLPDSHYFREERQQDIKWVSASRARACLVAAASGPQSLRFQERGVGCALGLEHLSKCCSRAGNSSSFVLSLAVPPVSMRSPNMETPGLWICRPAHLVMPFSRQTDRPSITKSLGSTTSALGPGAYIRCVSAPARA